MSERTVALLTRQGFAQARATLGQPGPRQASWNGQVSRHNTEYLVERARLDTALLGDLRAHGVAVREAELRGARREGTGWRLDTDGGPLECAFLVEARGRAAPAGNGSLFRGPPTVAVARLFSGSRGGDATAVVPFRDGWAWLGRSRDAVSAVQFTISTDLLPAEGQAGLTTLHDELCRQVPEIGQWLADGAEPLAPASARDCTLYLRDGLAGPDSLRIGDAACGLDPLSGQGVFMALAGALFSAAVVNTCLRRPQDAELAAGFYAARARQQFQEKRTLAGQFYASESRWRDAPFWRQRSAAPPPPEAAAPRPCRRERRPVVDNGWVVEREVFVSADAPLGVWRVEDVPVVELADHLCQDDGGPEAFAHRHALPLEAVARAVRWLHAAGAMTP